MKKYLLLLLISINSTISFSQNEITKIIIVRHAEKENDGTKNPSLSEIGKLRAEKLNKMFADVKFDKLFSTPYSRTKETLQPISTNRNLEITDYNPSDKNFGKYLVANQNGKTILVVGHSNTCPDLVNILINKSKYQSLDETEYGNIWILTFKNDTFIDCVLLNY